MAQDLTVVAFLVDADGDEVYCDFCGGSGTVDCACESETHDEHTCPECGGSPTTVAIQAYDEIFVTVLTMQKAENEQVVFGVASRANLDRRIAFDDSADAFIALDALRQMEEGIVDRLFGLKDAA